MQHINDFFYGINNSTYQNASGIPEYVPTPRGGQVAPNYSTLPRDVQVENYQTLVGFWSNNIPAGQQNSGHYIPVGDKIKGIEMPSGEVKIVEHSAARNGQTSAPFVNRLVARNYVRKV